MTRVPETRTEMDTHIAMTLLKTVVLSNIMQIIPAYNYSTLHLHLLYNTSENTSSNRYIASEWTFLINIGSFESLQRLNHKMKYIKHFIYLSLIRNKCKDFQCVRI